MDNTLNNHIETNRNQIDDPSTSSQRRRFLEGELDSLLKYKEHHPEKVENPSPLELFCDENPEAPECRIYEV
jgi:hypothetical protein